MAEPDRDLPVLQPVPSEGMGMLLDSTGCFLCEREIAQGEPFMTVLVFADRRRKRIAHVPFHVYCHIDAIADTVAEVLDDEGDGGGGTDEGEDLEDLTRKYIKRALAGFLR